MTAGREQQLHAVADAVRANLDPEDAVRVGRALLAHPERYIVLIAAYGGEQRTGQEWARLHLDIARQLESGGGAA